MAARRKAVQMTAETSDQPTATGEDGTPVADAATEEAANESFADVVIEPAPIPACVICGNAEQPLYWHHGAHRCRACRNKPA